MRKNQFVAVRVTSEIVRSLDEVAAQRGISRSTLIRDLLTNCHSLYCFLESERERQKTDKIILNGNISQWVLDNMPEGMTPDFLRFLGQSMHHAAEIMVTQGKKTANEELKHE